MKDKLVAEAIEFASENLNTSDFTHAIRVMFLVRDQMWDEKTQIVAVLHDAMSDDNDIDTYDKIVEWYGSEIADAVAHLATNEFESVKVRLKRVKSNPISRIVKIAELFDDLEPERLKLIHPSERKKHQKQLKQQLSFLSATEEGEAAFEV